MNSEVIALHEVGKLILEARIDDIKAKYPLKLHGKIDVLSEKDPSSNNKYLEWLAKQTLRATLQELKEINGGNYLNPEGDDLTDDYYARNWTNWAIQNENEKRVLFDNIDYFHNYIRKFEKRDINQYNTWQNFNEEVEKAKLKLSRKEIKQSGVIKIFEDDDFLLLTPLTHQAACRYGSNTRWCVSMRGYSGYFESYFTQGPIFFLMDKRMIPPTRSMQTEDYYKLAMHYRPRWEKAGRWGPTHDYLSNNKDAGKMANKLTKEEFVGGADKDKAQIDFWTTSDRQVQKNVAQKYMGGPGRGQKIRGQEFIGRFEDVMERYTKKILSDFYDNVSVDENQIIKLNNLKSELKLKNDYLDDYLVYSKNQLDRMMTNVERYKDNVSNKRETLPPDREKIQDFDLETDWIDSIKTSIEERRTSFSGKVKSMEEEIDGMKEEISKIQKEVELQFQFYDIEKSIQQKH